MQPIPLPGQKWQQITIDLVTDLPEYEGKTAITVFVDRLSKMVHFAPCTKEISAEKYGQLFVNHVFKHHGLPEVIISDRDPRFTSRFWRELFQKLRTDLRFSTAFCRNARSHKAATSVIHLQSAGLSLFRRQIEVVQRISYFPAGFLLQTELTTDYNTQQQASRVAAS